MPPAIEHVFLIAGETLAEALRRRAAQAVLWIAAALIAGTLYFSEVDFGGDRLRFASDFGAGVLFLFGSLAALLVPPLLFYGTLEDRSILIILSRPISRSGYLCGRVLGFFAVLGLLALLLGGTSAMLLLWLAPEAPVAFPGMETMSPTGVSWSGWVAHLFLQWIRLCVIASLSMLCAVFFRSPGPAIVVCLITLIISELRDASAAVYDRSESPATLLVQATMRLFPDLSVFRTNGWSHAAPPMDGGHLIHATAYGLLYAATATLFAVYFFRRRTL